MGGDAAATQLLQSMLLLLAGEGKGQGGALASLRAVLRTACQAVEAAQAVEWRGRRGCKQTWELRTRGSGRCTVRGSCEPTPARWENASESCAEACPRQHEQQGCAPRLPVDGEGRPQELNPADSACASWPEPPTLWLVRLWPWQWPARLARL